MPTNPLTRLADTLVDEVATVDQTTFILKVEITDGVNILGTTTFPLLVSTGSGQVVQVRQADNVIDELRGIRKGMEILLAQYGVGIDNLTEVA